MAPGDTPFVQWLWDRVRERPEQTQNELAERMGVSSSMLSGWLNGKQLPNRKSARKIAQFFEVPAVEIQELVGRSEPEESPPADQSATSDRRTPREIIRELEAALTDFPILLPETTQSASAGPGSSVEPEMWPYWPAPGERGHEFMVVAVTGDCMEPRIRAGERVVVDKTAEPRPGDVVLAYQDGEALVKLLERRDGELWLVALNGQPPLRVGEGTRVAGVVRLAVHRP